MVERSPAGAKIAYEVPEQKTIQLYTLLLPPRRPSRPTTSFAAASKRCTATTRTIAPPIRDLSARSSRCWPWRWCAPAATCSACRCWLSQKKTTSRSLAAYSAVSLSTPRKQLTRQPKTREGDGAEGRSSVAVLFTKTHSGAQPTENSCQNTSEEDLSRKRKRVKSRTPTDGLKSETRFCDRKSAVPVPVDRAHEHPTATRPTTVHATTITHALELPSPSP